jgi:hypothetical protein
MPPDFPKGLLSAASGAVQKMTVAKNQGET